MIAAPAAASGIVIASFISGRRAAILAVAFSCFAFGTLWGRSGDMNSARAPSSTPTPTMTRRRAGCCVPGSSGRRRIRSSTKTPAAYASNNAARPIAKSQWAIAAAPNRRTSAAAPL